MEIQEYTYEGNGMTRVYENTKWTVGIKTGNRKMISPD